MQMPKYAYYQGKIVPFEEATVSVMNETLNYGTGSFAGLRGFWNEDEEQMLVFRPVDHFTRLLNSARLLSMDFDYAPEEVTNILMELLRTEDWRENVYIRPLIYFTDNTIGVRLHDLTPALTIFSMPFGSYVRDEEGLHVTFSSWHRIDDNSIPARGKVTGAYVNSAFIKTDAIRAGYDEALVLNRDGHLSEGSAANFMMVRDGVLVTPPITDNILEGITRRTLIQLIRDELDMEVVERQVDRTEIYLAEEAFFCGTGVQVAAIIGIDGRPIGSGKMGPVVRDLRDLYFSVVRGEVEKYRHWCMPIVESVKVG